MASSVRLDEVLPSSSDSFVRFIKYSPSSSNSSHSSILLSAVGVDVVVIAGVGDDAF